ncbi:MAG: hypothetical protein V7K38_08800, partial [Nostoc sp.]|uniref:hypothetical protein n=1 Tax=Nostoc sp. TaxID=1180 RepID=UPI002FF74CA2
LCTVLSKKGRGKREFSIGYSFVASVLGRARLPDYQGVFLTNTQIYSDRNQCRVICRSGNY